MLQMKTGCELRQNAIIVEFKNILNLSVVFLKVCETLAIICKTQKHTCIIDDGDACSAFRLIHDK